MINLVHCYSNCNGNFATIQITHKKSVEQVLGIFIEFAREFSRIRIFREKKKIICTIYDGSVPYAIMHLVKDHDVDGAISLICKLSVNRNKTEPKCYIVGKGRFSKSIENNKIDEMIIYRHQHEKLG